MKSKLQTSITLFIVLFVGSLCWGDVRVLDLRCEYRVNPRGIDVAGPRLSWVLESNERSQRQSHYRILVASNEETLRTGGGDLWDSGKVVSDRTTQIVYGGKMLESGMVCCWKVKVWDGDNKPAQWSKPAIWSMGLLAPSDWKAEWIGLDSDIVPAKDKKKTKIYRPCPWLRKDFTLNKSVKRATVYATALGLYELHINGRRVGNDYLTPGWTDYGKRIYYQTYDVTDLVKGKADNTIGAILSDGWYAGNISNLGQAFYGWDLRVRAQLVVRYDDGSEAVIPTDGSWKGATGAILEADMQGGETYDARRALPGWDKPGFDETGWKKVDVTESVEAKIQAYPSAPTRRLREIEPVSVSEPKRRVFVLDMGTN
ncbi:MAG: alpha-L-rhamnosidase N-terminal domain-containing protein, partial [Planctomycetes bacterium]|nr:alpha-L-rhamnosidase N-terminal domain-containing protein [Planctomycetota bacterium]